MAEGSTTFDHTGDLGLEVWADTPERLFGLCAEALMGQVAEAPPRSAEIRRELELQGHDLEDLMVHWLNTALLESELSHAVWTRATVRSLGPDRLSATLQGVPIGGPGIVRLREVKAVSHHDLILDLEARPCRCRLILDL